MLGYWAIGRVLIATGPASITTMARTQAKIGRSMQKRATVILRCGQCWLIAASAAADALSFRTISTASPGLAFYWLETTSRSPAFRPLLTGH